MAKLESGRELDSAFDPFQLGHCWQYLILPLLDAPSLACLACTCSSFRELVDQSGAIDWGVVSAAQLLPEEFIPKWLPWTAGASAKQAKYLVNEVTQAYRNGQKGVFRAVCANLGVISGITRVPSSGHCTMIINPYGRVAALSTASSEELQCYPYIDLWFILARSELGLVGRAKLIDGALSADSIDLQSSPDSDWSNALVDGQGDHCQLCGKSHSCSTCSSAAALPGSPTGATPLSWLQRVFLFGRSMLMWKPSKAG